MVLTLLVKWLRYQSALGLPSRFLHPELNNVSPMPPQLRGRALLVLPLLFGISMQSALAQTIWLGPKAPDPEMMNLFKPEAPWHNAARKVQMVGVPVEYVSDSDVRLMFGDLHRRHIGAVMDMLALSGAESSDSPHCGYQVEGYSAPGQTVTVARRVKALGGVPAGYSMDEPLFYGHYYSRRNACRSSIVDIARDVATKIRQVRELFPDVEISDAEPLMGLPDATWQQDLAQWLDAFQAETGTKLSYIWLDLDWHARWQARLPTLVALLRQKGVGLGVIYNGDSETPSDEAWIASAVMHFKAFEAALGHSPDAVTIESWTRHPTHVLPESDPRTLTGLVNRYVAWKVTKH